MRVLVVDDSALMRKHLGSVLQGHELAMARNGREALELVETFCPDVITLDINMPEMDGLTALSMIMVKRPTPVVMVSSLTERGALATLEALNLGAVDFVAKPGGSISVNLINVRDEIRAKVQAAGSARLRRPRTASVAARPSDVTAVNVNVHREPATMRRSAPSNIAAPDGPSRVLVGVSTGGPRTLEDVLPKLPADFAGAVIVAQHMPSNFTGPLAERMNKVSALHVAELQRPTPLKAGTVLIARGGADVVVSRRGKDLYAMPCPASEQHAWHPSVQRLVESAKECCSPEQLTCVMLTGMGNDGAQAMTEVKEAGGRTIAESESTAVVFGMPAELIRRRGASVVLPSDEIAGQLVRWVGQVKEGQDGFGKA
jgi:two-component system, chemotaxis family, protein-glutamate methylesterase/glutaminase